MKSTKRRPIKSTSVDAEDILVDAEDILPEYDFSRARPNKFASRYKTDSLVVVLEPDVASAFPTASQANEALRALAGLINKHRLPATTSMARPQR